jgi:dTDP-4-dehydrorhamnose 3,5-epimerase
MKVSNIEFGFTYMDVDGPIIFKPTRISDNRGFFVKDYSFDIYKKVSQNTQLFETFYSFSKQNVFRGFGFQSHSPQLKIVSCIKGKIMDFVVDLRKNSNNFMKVYSVELNEDNNLSFIIPKGFGHGFLALSDSIVIYKCDSPYLKDYDNGIRFDDSSINIDFSQFGLKKQDLIISDRDLSFKTLKDSFNLLDF